MEEISHREENEERLTPLGVKLCDEVDRRTKWNSFDFSAQSMSPGERSCVQYLEENIKNKKTWPHFSFGTLGGDGFAAIPPPPLTWELPKQNTDDGQRTWANTCKLSSSPTWCRRDLAASLCRGAGVEGNWMSSCRACP